MDVGFSQQINRSSRLLDVAPSSLRSCKPLSEELVGKILAMVPFPYIFKARMLSKSWLARFSPVASLDDEVEKQCTIWFQKEVGELSYKWETYFPAYFGRLHSSAFVVGSLSTIRWKASPTTNLMIAPSCFLNRYCMSFLSTLPSLSFLPEKLLTCSNPEMEGPLLCWCGGSTKMILYVANILTRSWKQLPHPPQGSGSCQFYRKILVIEKSAQTYKVVVFCGSGRDFRVQIYDSRSEVWTTNRFLLSKDLKLLSPVVQLDGHLYMVACHNRANLLAFNVEERTLESLRFFSTAKLMMSNVDLVVSDGSLLIIVTNGFYPGGLQLLKFDIVTEQLVEVASGPPIAVCINPSFEMRRRRRPVCDGSSVYFEISDQMLEYNMKEDKWRCLDFPFTRDGAFPFMSYCEWSAFSFRPGLTPFVEV